MEICDRCYKNGDFKPSTKKITTNYDETFGLCETCYDKFTNFMDLRNFELVSLEEVIVPKKEKIKRKKRKKRTPKKGA